MSHILRGHFGYKIKSNTLRPLILNVTRLNFSILNNGNGGNQSNQNRRFNRRILQNMNNQDIVGHRVFIVRSYGMIVARVLRGALKLRYLLLGGAIGGGMTLNKKYEEWKDGLPDFKWLEDIMPDNEQWGKFTKSLINLRDNIKDSIEIDPKLKQLSEEKVQEWRAWFDNRLDNAIEAAEHQENQQIESMFNQENDSLGNMIDFYY